MLTFDATTREVCAVKRQTTATPLQALVLLNDPQFVEAARALAQRAMTEGGSSLADRITFVFRTLTGRRPGPRELATLEALYREQYDEFRAGRSEPDKLLAVGDAPRDPVTRPGRMRRHDRAGPGAAQLRGDGDEALRLVDYRRSRARIGLPPKIRSSLDRNRITCWLRRGATDAAGMTRRGWTRHIRHSRGDPAAARGLGR